MKILRVRFKNLNSLAGEWLLDFTRPEYASNGIFAITGPTGAGKTTILDAVCLGIYGRTPRLEKVTKSSNEIMSRQTGECFAEVTFETEKGRYRCHFSQHRARKQPDGDLQQARHEIVDADSGAVLESKITRVGEFIEKTTGMDFERFTRSMLLAQGGFAAFLQAPPDERAPILEQITGTEIYSRISIKVHERRTAERDRLAQLETELRGTRIFSDEEEKNLQTGLTVKRAREAELEDTKETLRKAVLWLERMAVLEKEFDDIAKKALDLEARVCAFAPEAKKLEKSDKAMSLEGPYQRVYAVRVQQDIEIKELHGATACLPEKEKTLSDLVASRQSAEVLLKEARDRQISETQIIKIVRDLDTRLDEQEKQLQDRDKSITGVALQAAGYKNNLGKIIQNIETSMIGLKAAADYLTGHAADAGLSGALGAIDRDFALMETLWKKHDTTLKALSTVAEKIAASRSAYEKLQTAQETSHLEFGNLQIALAQFAQNQSGLLQGHEIGWWRNEIDALRDRERLLIRIGEIVERVEKTTGAVNSLKTTLDNLGAAQTRVLETIKSGTEQNAMLKKEMAAMEVQVSLLNRIRDLEEERKRLEDGKPCPLCGAVEHPYALGNIPEIDQAQIGLKKKKEALRKSTADIGKLEAEAVRTTEAIRHAEKEMDEKMAALQKDDNDCIEGLLRLRISTDRSLRDISVREETTHAQAEILRFSNVLSMAEKNEKKEKSTQTSLEKARMQRDELDRKLQDVRHEMEAGHLEHQRLSRACDELAGEAEKSMTRAIADVKPFGITKIAPACINAIRHDLVHRKTTWQEKQEEKIVLEKRVNDLAAQKDKTGALLESLEKDLAQKQTERDNLNRQLESQYASRRELFGEKDPEKEERALTHAVERVEKTFEKAREAYGETENEIITLKEKIDFLKTRTDTRANQLRQGEEILADQIEKAGFSDIADFLGARLDEKEREMLSAREKSLIKEKTELDSRKKDRLQMLAEEQEKRLSDQPIEILNEKIEACDSELKHIRMDIGGIAKSLGENETFKGQQQDRIKALDAQKKECDRWDQLHQLIGSADGKKFRNFAQGLTFEMMTAHANQRLAMMTDRYLLIRDFSQPLELNVIDNYQAGEVRSTKNLSGGESFIVSLALALGLSHMASRNVRVDSLFLDEGFGTLDDDALETALETLAGLQQDGKLIGVISHVPALRERIGTQIQVIPETGGRSRIIGPGCQRI